MNRETQHLIRCAIALVMKPRLSEVAGESRAVIAHKLQVMLAADPTPSEVEPVYLVLQRFWGMDVWMECSVPEEFKKLEKFGLKTRTLYTRPAPSTVIRDSRTTDELVNAAERLREMFRNWSELEPEEQTLVEDFCNALDQVKASEAEPDASAKLVDALGLQPRECLMDSLREAAERDDNK